MKRFLGLVLCLTLLLPFGLGNISAEQAHSPTASEISPLAATLHILPPLGNHNAQTTQTDQTLAAYLAVKICQVKGGGCSPVYEFTAQKNNKGLDYLKLQNTLYHVNWNISKSDSGKTFEVHFLAAGLEIGSVTYTPTSGRTMPVRFQIDNHPRIRIHILHEQGYSAMEIADRLMDEFNLGANDMAGLMFLENFSGVEVGEVLKEVFNLEAAAAAQILKSAGFSVVEIALALKDIFGLAVNAVAQLLLSLGFSPTDITLILRDVFALGAYEAGLVLKELGFTGYTIQGMLIEVYDTYAVMVDIKSTVNYEPAPAGYTGLAYCGEAVRCTEPYIPGLLGQFVLPGDINYGIGGDLRYVYVKYDLVPKTSEQPVVTGMMAAHWPNWEIQCPAGWTPVNLLTTKTWSSCYRIGMCAQYQPFKDAEKFVTTPAMSYGDWGNPASKCSAVCGANSNLWPLYTDSLDIHKGCEDEHWVYFCYNQAEAWPSRPVTIEVSDSDKLSLLEQYAPRVYLAPELQVELPIGGSIILSPAERFYPSSVEWSFDHLFRYAPNDLPPFIPENYYDFWSIVNPFHLFPLYPQPFSPPDDNYYLTAKEVILDPSDWLEYHYGCNGSATANPCALSEAPAYAFWHKQTISSGGAEIEVADLTYFFYYPYNRGKEYFDTIWGSHVGDWEHITVRLSWVFNASTGWELKPIHLFASAHDFGTSHPWDRITTVPGTDHPIIYSAEGGHGNYVTAGVQRYGKVWAGPFHVFLYDYTGPGSQWDTWTNLETFDFDTEQGLGSSTWPGWMSPDYTAACPPDNPGCDPYDPASGAIYRWGGDRFGTCDLFGYDTKCRMAEGPTGPVDKDIWADPYEP